jgi:hypothetical protein
MIEPRGKGSIGCRAETCESIKEVCCAHLFGDEALCVPAETKATNCNPELGEEYYANALRQCDDSGDCPDGSRCCRDPSAVGATSCVAPSGTRSPCPTEEMCVTDKDCSVAAARCIKGECVQSKPHMRCNHLTCGPYEQCCFDPKRKGAATCAAICPRDWLTRDCHQNSDCLEGFKCCAGTQTHQRCYETCLIPQMHYVCQSDDDCAGIKVRTADLDPPYATAPRVDSYCYRYDWSMSWYPIPSRYCYPVDFDKYNPGLEEEQQRHREQNDWE